MRRNSGTATTAAPRSATTRARSPAPLSTATWVPPPAAMARFWRAPLTYLQNEKGALHAGHRGRESQGGRRQDDAVDQPGRLPRVSRHGGHAGRRRPAAIVAHLARPARRRPAADRGLGG